MEVKFRLDKSISFSSIASSSLATTATARADGNFIAVTIPSPPATKRSGRATNRSRELPERFSWPNMAAAMAWFAEEQDSKTIAFVRKSKNVIGTTKWTEKSIYVCSRGSSGGPSRYQPREGYVRKKPSTRTDCKCRITFTTLRSDSTVTALYSSQHNHEIGEANSSFIKRKKPSASENTPPADRVATKPNVQAKGKQKDVEVGESTPSQQVHVDNHNAPTGPTFGSPASTAPTFGSPATQVSPSYLMQLDHLDFGEDALVLPESSYGAQAGGAVALYHYPFPGPVHLFDGRQPLLGLNSPQHGMYGAASTGPPSQAHPWYHNAQGFEHALQDSQRWYSNCYVSRADVHHPNEGNRHGPRP